MGKFKSRGYSKEYSLITQSFVVFFEKGTAEQKTTIAKLRISHAGKLSSRGKVCRKSTAK